MLKVEKLTKKYGKRTVVDSLDFTGHRGEILGLLGPNGAGKSTTMNMLTGYIAPTSGSIMLDDMDLTIPKNRNRVLIGYMPEIPPLYNDMTVYEFMRFDAELKGVKRPERKKTVERIMEQCGITEVKDRLIKNLSKGYRQRVGFASAIVGDPEVIILDEPTAGLDPRQIVNMREMILSLKEDHLVILSSHILSEVEEVCDHVLIISKGKLVLSDNTEHLLEEHDESLEDVFLELTESDDETADVHDPLTSRYEEEEDTDDWDEAEDDNIEELSEELDEESDDKDEDEKEDDE